jgi:oligoendopeptidase F
MTDALTSPTGAEDVHWDLGDLYAGLDDPRLQDDAQATISGAAAFAERYRGRVGALDAAGLASAVAELEALSLPLTKAATYAHLRMAVDTRDPQIGALVARLQQQSSQAQSEVLFFDLEWGQVPDERAEALLADEALAGYRHHLERIRAQVPYQLSEPEERLLTALAPTGAAAWSRLFTQLTSAITVSWQGAEVPLEEALGVLHEGDRDRRRAAQEAITEALEADIATRAFVFNTLLADKAAKDRLRGRPDWLHSRNMANEAEPEQVQALVEAVTGRYDIVARYYRLKARVLGLDELCDWDRYAPIDAGEEHQLGWDDARDLVLDAYADFSPRMRDLAASFFSEGWIDAAVTPGKRAGAFASSVTPDVHPFVFLNFTGRQRDAMTLAHELGHGIHMRLSQRQTLFNASTPLTTAETASIFGETVTLARLLKATDDPRQRFALAARRLEDAFAAIFRQIAMNRFEDAVHTHRRETDELSVEDLGRYWTETQEAMFAGALTITPAYASWWSYVPHFIAVPGYVYAYAFGNLLSFALYRRYEEEGEGFVPRYLEMLSHGGSQPPHVLMRPLGVDLTDPGFWDAGLDVLDEEVGRAEELAAAAEGARAADGTAGG